MGVYHEPDELPEQLCGPAEADGVGRGHTAVGGRHLGGVLRAHLGKSTLMEQNKGAPCSHMARD